MCDGKCINILALYTPPPKKKKKKKKKTHTHTHYSIIDESVLNNRVTDNMDNLSLQKSSDHQWNFTYTEYQLRFCKTNEINLSHISYFQCWFGLY